MGGRAGGPSALQSAMPDEALPYRVKILDKTPLNHDVDRWTLERPDGYAYTPGQATSWAVDRDGLRDAPRPFTYTGLPDAPTLELVIKRYPSHDGVTDELSGVGPGEHFLMGEPRGDLTYRGPGTFIAGGAGVTPFLAMLRRLERDGELAGHRLIFANSTAADVFLKDEFDRMLGERVHYRISEDAPGFATQGIVDRGYLSATLSGFAEQWFYLCGPPSMGPAVYDDLIALGAKDEHVVHVDWSD